LETVKTHPELIRLGYFGSYARDEWGVGSDLDLVAIVAASEQPFERRSLAWNLDNLPVPAELLVYTQVEWRQLPQTSARFAQTLAAEVVWVYINES
jgi:predicted nucleotidyltransferase